MKKKQHAVVTLVTGVAAALVAYAAAANQRVGTVTPAPPWRIAVAFQRTPTGWRYAGAAALSPHRDYAGLPAGRVVADNLLEPRPARADYEVWLEREGATGIVDCDSHTGECRALVAGAHWQPDPWHIDHLLARLAPTVAGPPRAVSPALSSAELQAPPLSLAEAVSDADVVVSGTFAAQLCQHHDPRGSGSIDQSTVYLLAVDTAMKGFTRPPPWVMKVSVPNGDLPWTFIRNSGAGRLFVDMPEPALGRRYVAFLDRVGGAYAMMGMYDRLGYIPGGRPGREGRDAELDEYIVADAVEGLVSVEHGLAVAAPLPQGRETLQWRYDIGPQLLGLPVQFACERIRGAVRENAAKARALDAAAQNHVPSASGASGATGIRKPGR
ncbi:MAG: hypothetical protein KGK12_07820 [Armatimonadetes bacterium]|nr:hypothetical protein [Armatimonadota bacterium]